MTAHNYPSSYELIFTFIHNLRRNNVNIIKGMNPSLINMNGTQMYIYIKNLSPAQLSNDNPDIWRIQLPKRDEFHEIKRSDKMFVLFGYDYIRKVYTTWNPYWCKQRLNVAESCSMYSRFSLQVRVSNTQKIEKMQLQNEGDVVCIPSALLGNYLLNIKDYYPKESVYVPIGSSIQKRILEEKQTDETVVNDSSSMLLYNSFIGCYDVDGFRDFLTRRGYQIATISNYINRLKFVFEKRFLQYYKDLFLEYNNLGDYKHAVNKLCWKPEVLPYEELWHKAIQASLKQYLLYVEERLYGSCGVIVRIRKQQIDLFNEDSHSVDTPKLKDVKVNAKGLSKKVPTYKLDEFGKLQSLDSEIIDQLSPMVKGVEYPDYETIIKEVKQYYPEKATEKMTPADWMKLFDSTKWRRKRGRKTVNYKVEPNINNLSNIDVVSEMEDNGYKRVSSQNLSNLESKEHDVKIYYIDAKTIKTVFDKKVTSYKYFWFNSIISLAKEHDSMSISYRDIVIRMAAMAWPIIMEYGIDLGKQDMLKPYLLSINKKARFINGVSSKVVETHLKLYYTSQGYDKILLPLLSNVPYRFLSPWVPFTTKDEVVEKSNLDQFDGLYALNKDGIVLNKEWWGYISTHYQEIYDFSYKSFLAYAKQFNNDIALLRFMTNGWSFLQKK